MTQDPQMDPDSPNEYRYESRSGKFLLALLAFAAVLAGLPLILAERAVLNSKGLAPEIIAEGWVNGDAPTKESLAGKVVVVSVWATWCGPCRKEAPHLVEVYRKYADQGVVFIGLTSEGSESLPDIKQFVKSSGISWPNGWGAAKTTKALEAVYIPALYVIARDGRLVWFNQQDGGEIEEVLDVVLRQPSNRS